MVHGVFCSLGSFWMAPSYLAIVPVKCRDISEVEVVAQDNEFSLVNVVRLSSYVL
jgi:hypothetical protein